MVSASAPGKLLLFGEHVSRHGKPALVFAVDKRIEATIEKRASGIVLNSPDLGIENEKYPSKKLDFVSEAIKQFSEKTGKTGFFSLTTKSNIPAGIGSSAAAVVATLGALDAHFKTKLSKKEIADLGFRTISAVQGFGSGQDITCATYGGLLRFEKGKDPVQVKFKQLPIVVGNTGVKVKSGPIIEDVTRKEKKYSAVFGRIIDSLGDMAPLAQAAIEKNDLETVGELMNVAHGLLYAEGVSSPVLEKLVWAARDAGALGAKLSGAGVGDNMIALCRPGEEKKVAKAIEKAGGKVLGLKVEPSGLVAGK